MWIYKSVEVSKLTLIDNWQSQEPKTTLYRSENEYINALKKEVNNISACFSPKPERFATVFGENTLNRRDKTPINALLRLLRANPS